MYFSFFFQAEDGIRDGHVTGVQTCALPIFARTRGADDGEHPGALGRISAQADALEGVADTLLLVLKTDRAAEDHRSEERRVGEEWRGRGAQDDERQRNYVQ